MKKIVFKKKFEILKEYLTEEILKRKPGEKLPTEHELVKIYNVNRGTINKVLSFLEQEGLIERKTKVGTIIKPIDERKLNYRIGVLIERATGHVYGKLTHLIIRQMQENLYFPVLIDNTPGKEEISLNQIEDVIENRPEFIVIDGVGDFRFDLIKKNISKIKNLIFINKFESELKFKATFILSDYEMGGFLGTEYLFNEGCRNIILVTQANPSYLPNIDIERIKGVKKAFKNFELKFEEENLIVNKGEDYLKEKIYYLFNKKKKDIGIFAFADYVARKVQKYLEEKGIWLGIDYKMIGYFNTPYSMDFEPQISSISINEEGLAENLGKILKEGKFPKKTFQVPQILIKR
ncbi:MAG: GntR family transcriptional regulator [Candidatus Omnitrophica bacterium]|nr:GntR family transcriptional regulator [Candidatus Omnitrophota bacterium]MCM8802512.1 GntR family transcriptional regulator [Candidatus Omnitrophota bacterium]